MGVGPEQNFTYIAALKPTMAIIVDIRHGNLDVHLMYKALFEMSKDRADSFRVCFRGSVPDGLSTQSSASEIFDAYALVRNPIGSCLTQRSRPSRITSKRNTDSHSRPAIWKGSSGRSANYYRFGPGINYNSSVSSAAPEIVGATGFGGRNGGFGAVTYADLMMADDGNAEHRSYLATEENFTILKDLETKNLLVPAVGDFGGSKALREVGKYLKSIDAKVSAFYLSNVEQYLSQDGKTGAFLANVARCL